MRKTFSRSLVSAELKCKDTSISGAYDATYDVTLLNGMIQGTDFDERVGRQIHVTDVELDAVIKVTAATGVDQVFRTIVVRDKQANGVAPVMSDVFTDAFVYSPVNLSNKHRFVILYDRVDVMNASAEPGSVAQLKVRFPVNCLTTYNAGVAGTIADINTNSIYLITVGTEAAGATAGSRTGNCRLRYYDL